MALRHFTVFEFPPADSRSAPQGVQNGTAWQVNNNSVRAEPFEWALESLHGVDRPRLTQRDAHDWVEVSSVIPAGFILYVRESEVGEAQAWMSAPGRATYDLSEFVQFSGNVV